MKINLRGFGQSKASNLDTGCGRIDLVAQTEWDSRRLKPLSDAIRDSMDNPANLDIIMGVAWALTTGKILPHKFAELLGPLEEEYNEYLQPKE